jgi:hypothetical protein
MTAKQASYLRFLAERAGEEFDGSLSREEARQEISRLKALLEGRSDGW